MPITEIGDLICSDCGYQGEMKWTSYSPIAIDPPEPYCPNCRSFSLDEPEEEDNATT